jgi:hypothetical protein
MVPTPRGSEGWPPSSPQRSTPSVARPLLGSPRSKSNPSRSVINHALIVHKVTIVDNDRERLGKTSIRSTKFCWTFEFVVEVYHEIQENWYSTNINETTVFLWYLVHCFAIPRYRSSLSLVSIYWFLYVCQKMGSIMLWHCPSSCPWSFTVFRTFFRHLCSYGLETWCIAL